MFEILTFIFLPKICLQNKSCTCQKKNFNEQKIAKISNQAFVFGLERKKKIITNMCSLKYLYC